VKGLKDKKDTRFDGVKEFVKKNGYDIEIEIINTPMFANGINATRVRNFIVNGEIDNFFNSLPEHLTMKEKNLIWKIVNSKAIVENKNIILKESKNMIERKKIIEELKLRDYIGKIVEETCDILIMQKKQMILEEKQLRNEIRKILNEIKDEETPESSTGINVLKDLLKKIIPILETDYKSLTTSKEQRVSFRSHIIRATKTTIEFNDQTNVDKEVQDEKNIENIDEQEKIHINIKDDDNFGDKESEINEKDKSEKFIDITKQEKGDDDFFTIEGEDQTGRNVALKSYEKIEKNISDAFNLLSDEEDKSLFTDYLLTNLKMYFDKFEQELSAVVTEPTTLTYEKEKEQNKEEERETQEQSIEL